MRVIRLLIYEGDEEWIAKTNAQNFVKGERIIGTNRKITSVILGSVPDELSMFLKNNTEDGEKCN
jgi:hypothetical protein